MQHYDCHIETAKNVLEELKEKFGVLIFGMPQIGKTSIIQEIMIKLDSDINIIVMTGLSSIDWMKQTKERLNDTGRRFSLYHLSTINNISHIRPNSIIFLDECHIAIKQNQTLDILFNKFSFDYLVNNQIKLVYISATPDAHLIDCHKSKNFSVICPNLPEKYISPSVLLEKGHLIDGYEYSDEQTYLNHLIKIKKDFIKLNMYGFIRLPTHPKYYHLYSKIKEIFVDCKYIEYFEDNKIAINELMNKMPQNPTIIYVKNKLRCSHTFEIKYISFMYERIPKEKNINNSTITQSFVGRACGYKNIPINFKIYTNLDSIYNYVELHKNVIDNTIGISAYKSNTLKITNTIKTKVTFNRHFNVCDKNQIFDVDQMSDQHPILDVDQMSDCDQTTNSDEMSDYDQISDCEQISDKKEKITCSKVNKVKKSKKKIPNILKMQLWDKYVGLEIGKIKCLCCNFNDIFQIDFEAGHVVSESIGGKLTLENLRPICKKCNQSMATKNLFEFKKMLQNAQ
jgi:hypothetical protein